MEVLPKHQPLESVARPASNDRILLAVTGLDHLARFREKARPNQCQSRASVCVTQVDRQPGFHTAHLEA